MQEQHARATSWLLGEVLIALAALVALFEVLLRERRRARREEALCRAAESLARAFDTTHVAQHVANGAMNLLSAANVFVVHVDTDASATRLTVAPRPVQRLMPIARS